MNNATLVGIRLVRWAAWVACAGTLLLLSALDAGAVTKYFDFSTGSDANNGNSTATPYKRPPGFPGASHGWTPAAGDTLILKGGVTWTPAGQQWAWSWSGTAGNPITITADPAWFAGGAFTAPLVDFADTIIGPGGWVQGAGLYITSSYVTVSGLEFARHRAQRASSSISTWGTTTICLDSGSNRTITNCVVRDWSLPTSGGTPNVEWNGGGAIMRVNNGSNDRVTDCLFHQDAVAQKSGTACWNIGTVDNCECRNTPQFMMNGQLAYNNWIHDLPDPTDPMAHSNVFLCPGTFTCYNNLIHDIGGKAQVIFGHAGYYGAGTLLVYNNTVWNVLQPCVAIDTDGVNSPLAVTRVYNNTLVGPGGTGFCIRTIYHGSAPAAVPYLDYKNNHLISTDPLGINNISRGNANVTTLVQANNLLQTLPAVNALGYTTANAFQPIDATKPTVATGTDLSAYFTTDRLGVARPQAGLWNLGSYVWQTVTGAGTITLAASTASVSEEAGSITITAHRTGGSTGAIGCSYATANGSATAGVNYTSTSGTFSWGNGDTADKTVAVPIIDANTSANPSFTFTVSSATGGATLGTPTTETITILGSGTPPITLLDFAAQPWTAPSSLGAPFVSYGDYYAQSVQTIDPADGGMAVYYFTNNAGNYRLYMEYVGASDSENSCFVRVNGTPVSPDNIFDATVTAVPLETAVSQRGASGTFDSPEFPSYEVALPAGVTNSAEVIGREANFQVYSLRFELIAEEPPMQPPAVLNCAFVTADGYYKAGSTITASVKFSTNVTVSGAPTLINNAGALFGYTSGSGTDTLVFDYVVGAGQNNQSLDYSATNSLSLNGGSIKFGAVDANLTLPAPGEPGSLSYGRAVVVDTIAPTATISGPNVTLTPTDSTVFYTVTYFDLNYAGNTLSSSDVTVNGTATATIQVGPNNPFNNVAIALANLTDGVGSVSIAPGTASDLAGNTAAAIGPSNSFVVNGSGTGMKVIYTRAGTVIQHQ